MADVGRPTKYNDFLYSVILKLVEDGKTDQQVCDIVGIAKSTFNKWKLEKPEFSASVKDAKEIANELVEATLLQKALGYKTPEVKVFFDAKNGECIEHEITKHHSPDTASIIFWLKNRRPDLWREKIEVANEEGKSFAVSYVPKSKRDKIDE